MAESAYKRYARNTRITEGDLTFAGGMKFTNNPIETGYNKRLVNFILANNGTVLTSRAPLRKDREITRQRSVWSAPDKFYFDFDMMGVRGALTNNPDYKKVFQLHLDYNDDYPAILNNLPGDLVSLSSGQFADYYYMADEEISSPSLLTQTHSVFMWDPQLTGFNNLSFATNVYMRKPVATEAFNGKYVSMGGELYPTSEHTYTGKAGLYFYDAADLTTSDKRTPKTPRALEPSEAAAYGYNMLADNPYEFANGESGTTTTLTGILPYTADGSQIILNPKVNQTIMIRAYYSLELTARTSRSFKFEWKDLVASSWNTIGTVVMTSATTVPQVQFTNPGREIQIRVTAIDRSVNPNVEEHVMVSGFDFTPQAKTTEFKTHRLYLAQHMDYWRQRIVLWGVPTAKNAIFLSEFNDPTYFPYPNNFEEFDEPVVYCIEYLNDLLVFTERNIWNLSLNADGLTWTKSLVQAGVNIKDEDAVYIKRIKTFVMFKQNNYFYLIVPYASTAGSLAVSPISEPIAELLDDYKGFIDGILADVYGYPQTYELIKMRTFTTTNDIHVGAVLHIPAEEEVAETYLCVDLVYSTLLRAWSTRVYETENVPVASYQQGQVYPELYTLLQDQNNITVKHLRFEEESLTLDDQTDSAGRFPNIHMLDTGYRKVYPEIKKRYREVQYMIHLYSASVLEFALDFWIDGAQRRESDVIPKVYHEIDPQSSNYGYISVVYEQKYDNLLSGSYDPQDAGTEFTRTDLAPGGASESDPYVVWDRDPNSPGYGNTDVAYNPPTPVYPPWDAETSAYWKLDVSRFVAVDYWRVRSYVSGKGEAGRMIVRSFNDHKFDIYENYWVFRPMYGR